MKDAFKNVNVVPMPLFQQVKESIRKKILDGSYRPHEKLPSEREMIALFSVSRITIRQALAELQREGLIFKINGKGTFVSMPKARFDVSTLRGFGESAASIGQEAFSKLISISSVEADAALAQNLQVDKKAPLTRIQRLRYLNREPLAFDITYASQAVGERICAADLERRDLFDILENDCGVRVDAAEVNIESLTCEADLAAQLNIEQNSAILHIERSILDDREKPVLYENLYYRGDSFKFGMHIERTHLTP